MIKKWLLPVLLFTSFQFNSFSQIVDQVRLGYDKNSTLSDQINMCVSRDGEHIAFVYSNNTVKIYKTSIGKFIKTFIVPFTGLFEARFTQRGDLLVFAEKRGRVLLYDWKYEAQVFSFNLPDNITRVAVSPRDNVMAFGLMGGETSIWDMTDYKEYVRLTSGKHHVSALDFHPGKPLIAVGVMSALRDRNPLLIYNYETKSIVHNLDKSFYVMANFSEGGDTLMLGILKGLGNPALKIYNVADQKLADDVLFKKFSWVSVSLYTSSIVHNGLLMTSTIDRSFDVFNISSGERMFTTKRDKTKWAQAFSKMGIDIKRIYRIGTSDKFIVNYYGNNINVIYDAAQNAISGYIYSDSNEDFVVVARDGRVDGSPDALENVFWSSRKSSKKTSLISTFERAYTPRLFQSLLNPTSLDQDNKNNNKVSEVDFEIDDVVDIIPSIIVSKVNNEVNSNPNQNGTNMYKTSQKVIPIEISVIENAGEIKEVRLYQNRKLVGVIDGDQTKASYHFDATLTNTYGEENYFYAVASSVSGIDSEKQKFIINYESNVEEKPKLYLITIGINEYKNTRYNLNYAVTDADAFEEKIMSGTNSLFDSIKRYTIRNDYAIKSNIMSVMNSISLVANEQDMLIFYYAGHGVMSEGMVGEPTFYIVPHNVTRLYGADERLIENAISADQLKEFSATLNAQKQVFILDACQSAGAIQNMARGAVEERAIAQLARSTGTFWITATGSDQFALEFEKLGHGVFTYALIEGLGGKADGGNSDKKITVKELSAYIENRVPELSDEYKGKPQYPAGFSYGNDFPIVIYD